MCGMVGWHEATKTVQRCGTNYLAPGITIYELQGDG